MDPQPAGSFNLTLFPERFAVCRLPAEAPDPEWARPGALLAALRTPGEFSLVCEERFAPPEIKAERGWRLLMVQGPLDFSLVGVLAGLAQTLAAAQVTVLALSTFDTDLLLVKADALETAVAALQQAGYGVERYAPGDKT